MTDDVPNIPIERLKRATERIVVLSGAGMSAESGLRTFRDNGGLWEQYSIYEVATPEAWARDQAMVLRFYNERRRQLLDVRPNQAHLALARLEKAFAVEVVTQNIDDLHERAGSSSVLHLHGELRKARSSIREDLIYDIDGWEIREGDLCEAGHQLRPHVVWFGEPVPMMFKASEIVRSADLLLVIGSSLSVYPAAGLVQEVSAGTPTVLIDPGAPEVYPAPDLYHLKKPAGEGVVWLTDQLLEA